MKCVLKKKKKKKRKQTKQKNLRSGGVLHPPARYDTTITLARYGYHIKDIILSQVSRAIVLKRSVQRSISPISKLSKLSKPE